MAYTAHTYKNNSRFECHHLQRYCPYIFILQKKSAVRLDAVAIPYPLFDTTSGSLCCLPRAARNISGFCLSRGCSFCSLTYFLNLNFICHICSSTLCLIFPVFYATGSTMTPAPKLCSFNIIICYFYMFFKLSETP